MKVSDVDPAAGKPNRQYCARLAELAFPTEVWIEKASYTKATLESKFWEDDELREDNELLNLLVKLCFLETRAPQITKEDGKTWETIKRELKAWKINEVLNKLFPSVLEFGSGKRKLIFKDRTKLYEALLDNPQLQQHIASMRYYMPSKWLVEQERIARKGPTWTGDVYEAVAKERLTGVCFSGGGIRSATFNLGVLQGMAQLGFLPRIDYLSSVSGGGYIHEFFAGWILRNGNLNSVALELIPQAQPGCLPRAPEPIQWLKRYASYLTPTRGFFSADTWTLVAIWFRNMILNQIAIVASFGVALFALHLLVPYAVDSRYRPTGGGLSVWGWWLAGTPSLTWVLYSLWRLGKNFYLQELRASSREEDSTRHLLDNSRVVKWVILPWLSGAAWLNYWIGMRAYMGPRSLGTLIHTVTWDWRHSLVLAPVAIACGLVFVLTLIVIFAGGALNAWQALNLPPEQNWLQVRARRYSEDWWTCVGRSAGVSFLFILGGLLATVVACAMGWAFFWAMQAFAPWLSTKIGALNTAQDAHQLLKFSANLASSDFHATLEGSITHRNSDTGLQVAEWRVYVTLLPALLLSVPYVAIELTLGLLGRDYRDIRREWLARLRAWSVLYGMLWCGLVGITLLGPYLGYWISQSTAWKWSTAIGFVVSHLTTVLGGASGKSDGKPTEGGLLGFKPVDLLALIAAPFAMVSLLLLLSFCASMGVDALAAQATFGVSSATGNFLCADALCIVVALAIALLMGWRVDINEFSMHSFYRNRISRCYLGAVVPGHREPDPFTGFDGRESVTMTETKADGSAHQKKHNLEPFVTELLPKRYTRDLATGDLGTGDKGVYDGPFPIFCTTLNLTTGEDLATQERKGTSFAFTPLYSGYSFGWTDGDPCQGVSFNGYVPTNEYAYPKEIGGKYGGIHIDSAVSISGAAANPNMGYNSSRALAFLMTVFNVRLGWWICNPRKIDLWRAATSKGRSTPRFALVSLIQELFGAVGDDAQYINLSDGGHFENMGLYELVRRRTRYIVVCDAEGDSKMTFDGIGMAITKCRADFGAEIDLDLRPLRLDPATGFSNAHCVVGTVRYPPPWASAVSDTDEDIYSGVIVYMKSSLVGDEPADLMAYKLKSADFPQDSTANQWFTESKFEAYRRLGHHVAISVFQPALPPEQSRMGGGLDEIPRLFDRLYSIWYPRTPEMQKYLLDHLKQYEAILTELRQRPELVGLEERLNTTGSQWVWNAPALPPQSDLYATQFANSVLDFMYTVYTNLELAFPDNLDSPHAECWVELFTRWCRISLLHHAWQTHVAGFPVEFRIFARRHLKLPKAMPWIE